jgi:hypothetical protein
MRTQNDPEVVICFMVDDPDQLLSIPQAARVTSRPAPWLYEAAGDNGDLDATRIDGRPYVRVRDLMSFVHAKFLRFGELVVCERREVCDELA